MTAIEFVLNGKIERVDDVSTTRTLLDWLREEKGLTGTKEGCNEGDCGACTVAIRKRPQGQKKSQETSAPFAALNACIRFMPTLDGHEIVTIEHLASTGALHPIQAEFSQQHASQCGFCTPGFVMSAYAAGAHAPSELRDLNDLYAGNLCRCTGYGPILEATKAAQKSEWPHLEHGPTACGTDADDDFTYHHGDQTFFAPARVDSLCALAEAHPNAVLLAGATDVGLWVTKQGRPLDTLISIDRVSGFAAIEETDSHLIIGAGASYTAAWQAIGELYPDMGELIRRIGSVQIRNAGTIGGNIANGSPIGDMPPALIAAGAELHLRQGQAARTIALEDFFIAYGKQDRKPGEVVLSLHLPKPRNGSDLTCYKISKRFDQDISAVCAAINLTLEEGVVTAARIAYGGMAATPKRANLAEQSLIGHPFDEIHIRSAMEALTLDFQPITDMRASADYRMRTAQNLLYKYFVERTELASETRLVGRMSYAPRSAAS